MKIMSDPRIPFTIPFTMEIPDSQIISDKKLSNNSDPCIEFVGREFYMNLIWGPTYGVNTDLPPVGYELERQESIGQDNNVDMIVARTSANSLLLFTFYFVRSLIIAAVIGVISLGLLPLLKLDIDISKWIGLAVFVFMLSFYSCRKSDVMIKYAFTYKGNEYIFTSAYRHKDALYQAIKTIRFND